MTGEHGESSSGASLPGVAQADEAVALPGEKKMRRPRTRHVRSIEDLKRADTLRPAEVWLLHGIPASSVHDYCTHLPPLERLPSVKIRGIKGRRGLRLINRVVLDLWLAWQQWRESLVEPRDLESAAAKSFPAWREQQAKQATKGAKNAA